MVVKSRVTELLDNVDATDKFLGTAVGTVERRLATAVQASEQRIVNLMRQLETNTSGRLEGVKINLKQAQRNHKDLLKIMEQEYGIAVDEVIEDFSQITRFIERSWRDLGESAAYTAIDKDMIATLEASTWDQFKAFGDDATNQIADAMYAQVVAGGRFSDLMTAVEGVLTGHVDARGRPMTAYTKQFANDAVMNFHNEVNLKKGEDLGMNQFLYVGDIIGTTRQFCQVRAMKTYTRNQIDSWTHDWQGKSGPAYEYRGGYNCRHHWRPIRKEWLDDEFGETTEDELFAMSQAQEYPIIGGAVTDVDALKAKHEASQEKSKALKTERKTASAARKKEINKALVPLKNERRVWSDQIKGLKGDLSKQGKKLKQDLRDGKKPKALTKKTLKAKPVRSTAKTAQTPTPKGTVSAAESLQSNGVQNIVDVGEARGKSYKIYKDYQKQVIEPLADEMNRLANFGNGFIGDGMSSNQIRMSIYNDSYIPVPGRGKPFGSYTPSVGPKKAGRIKLGVRGNALISGEADSVLLGEWSVGESTMHNFRHEMGHHVNLRLMNRTQRANWGSLSSNYSGSWVKSNVSHYAAANESEMFAEVFAAYTNPNYRRGTLDKKLESFMKNLLGG